MRIGIRSEDKNDWETRVPLTPGQVGQLTQSTDLRFVVQPSAKRIFPEAGYIEAGAQVSDDLSECPVIIGVKEIPVAKLAPRKTYVFFAHVIKGQPANMPMLRKLMELGCTLIDYERIVDDKDRRLIFFGRYAGLAGMIDTLWALGQRLRWEGLDTPFARIEPALKYADSEEAKKIVAAVGDRIREQGLPEPLHPLVCGFAGYGHVSQGAQEIFDQLPATVIPPEAVASLRDGGPQARHHLYKVIFKEEHLVEPKDPDARFELQDYYDHPEKYRSRFGPYLDHLTILANCIYWDARYPRLVTKERVREMYSEGASPRLRVIGDITCDLNGSIECNVRCADSGNPIYVYDPATDRTHDGVAGRGPVVLAVDNLPCELPREASADFGAVLTRLLPKMGRADWSQDFEHCNLPDEIRRATILYRGQLTEKYQYLTKYL